MDVPIPIPISNIEALNSIGENIIIADNEYKIVWMNTKATRLFSFIAPLYGLTNADDLIGLHMDYFHKKPDHQRHLMKELGEGHRVRINIKGKFVADIVVTPIKRKQKTDQNEGYMVMLMDVTSKVEEEKNKEKIIKDLSAPILDIWDKTIAITLVGEFDLDRGEIVILTVLEKCASKGVEYVMISLRGIDNFDESVRKNLQMLYDCLKLIGVECIIVGVTPKLAINIQELRNISTFSDAHAGLKYIMALQDRSQ